MRRIIWLIIIIILGLTIPWLVRIYFINNEDNNCEERYVEIWKQTGVNKWILTPDHVEHVLWDYIRWLPMFEITWYTIWCKHYSNNPIRDFINYIYCTEIYYLK